MQRRFMQKRETGWEGALREGYDPQQTSRVVRNTIVGWRKDAATDEGPQMEIRYFEVPPGAATRLEKHEHEHVVIVGEGVGVAVVGNDVREVRPHDVVYVAPLEPHQFSNRGSATFGFYCVVAAHRDRGRALDDGELATLSATAAGSHIHLGERTRLS